MVQVEGGLRRRRAVRGKQAGPTPLKIVPPEASSFLLRLGWRSALLKAVHAAASVA